MIFITVQHRTSPYQALRSQRAFLNVSSLLLLLLLLLLLRHANIDLAKITVQSEQIVHLVASVHSGHTSAIQVLARFGAAARVHPLYEALA